MCTSTSTCIILGSISVKHRHLHLQVCSLGPPSVRTTRFRDLFVALAAVALQQYIWTGSVQVSFFSAIFVHVLPVAATSPRVPIDLRLACWVYSSMLSDFERGWRAGRGVLWCGAACFRRQVDEQKKSAISDTLIVADHVQLSSNNCHRGELSQQVSPLNPPTTTHLSPLPRSGTVGWLVLTHARP